MPPDSAAARLCTKDTVKKTGFNVWVSGEHDDNGPEVDVVAVQGLGANPYYTWVKKSVAAEVEPSKSHWSKLLRSHRRDEHNNRLAIGTQTASDTAECMWLRDILPDSIPNVRIATFSYESDWRNADIKPTLRKCGEQLLNVLLHNRTTAKETRRPLVFIGHSLGGLVIKQALVVADHDEAYKDIRLSTAGIIFLGTPHQGSDAAVYGVRLARILKNYTTLLESLKKNSDILYDIARDFEASHRSTDIVCYYEEQEKAYGPWRTKFVDHQSASLYGKRAIYLSTDHSGLNKFSGSKDENFMLVQPEIERLVHIAPKIVAERFRFPTIGFAKEIFRVKFSLKGIRVVEKFVARDEEMTQLRKALLPTTDPVRRKVFVLHGLGGIGKTQLSVELTRTYQARYSAVLWIDGSSKERLRQSIADIAERLPQHQLSEGTRIHSQNGATDNDKAIKDVLGWLSRSSNNQWLLIFDNVDRVYSDSVRDPEAFDVTEYFPEADQGSILITSRLVNFSQLGLDMKLGPVAESQGATILEDCAGRTVADSLELVKLLQGLLLAIKQAGSYMRMTGTNVVEYIELYNRQWADLMEKQHHSTSQDQSILTTWTLSYKSLQSRSEDTANLLRLWAFLHNQDLWYELFTPVLEHKVTENVPSWFARCVGNRLEFNECIRLLLEYSFVDVTMESTSFSIHPVLHHWCFHAYTEDTGAIGWLAMIVVASAIRRDLGAPLVQRCLLQHCDHVYSMLQEDFWNHKDQVSVGSASRWLGGLYRDQDKTKEAEDVYLRGLMVMEKTLGPGHELTLDTVWGLGIVYWGQGKIPEAEDMYLRALAGYQKVYGPEHDSVFNVINSLGVLYKDQGKEKEAENMYLRAFAGYKEICGLEHTSVPDVTNNLGNLYADQGKDKEAEDMYRRALVGYEKYYGPEHTSVLDVIRSLGILYQKKGRRKEAEDMYLRALAGYEQAYGAEGRKTLQAMSDLGSLYFDQGRMKEAEDWYLRALTGTEKALGPEDRDTIVARYNLGVLCAKRRRFEEAKRHFEVAVQGFIKTLGPEHKDTVTALKALELAKSHLRERGGGVSGSGESVSSSA